MFSSNIILSSTFTEEDKKQLSSSSEANKVMIKPSDMRYFNINNPYENMYRFAAGHFYNSQLTVSIESMDILSNPKLKAAFYEKQGEFERRDIPYLPIFVCGILLIW